MEEIQFRRDLFKGTAGDYDRFRPPYPAVLIADLIARTGTGGRRLLDLACGTGQIAFLLHDHFSEVLAVDQEQESVVVGRDKADRLGVTNIRWIVRAAEELHLDPIAFDLIAIGNAFHRLPRRLVAQETFEWLVPGGCLTLLWTDTPWVGQSDWQNVTTEAIRTWMTRAGTTDRIPANLDRSLEEDPHEVVMGDAGFEIVGKFEFAVTHQWTVETLTGFLFSTSFLSRAALGDHARQFETDLRARLLAVEPSGTFDQSLSFAYHLARRPADH